MGECAGRVRSEQLKKNLYWISMYEHFFQCPYCWEEISMLLDPSISQSYIEDCENCCNPIEVSTKFENGELIVFNAVNIEQ